MEELQAIADMIEGLGQEGVRAFIWYLILDRGASLLTTVIILVPITWVLSRVSAAIATAIQATD